MSQKPEDRSEIHDELNPEWTAYESAWAVDVADFPSPVEAAEFVLRRKQFFLAAQAAGFPKELLTPFEPNKPGFEERARKAFTALPKAMGWAAE
ncbi:hypothetical protein P1J78_17470 [Psychromarinibacter sp. C21-152]|uniref:Uncharacterized protein n=1 Tax=Psychromarinibacter sediminicola TaxID=3033385 RepID=A0AAE3NUW3_9RHOB|nr:hypothetical protein [Psychromarinibacter sediminicola]MDF0602531.1 hypothetical protein [Psychromarinibacter sediminicola]